MRAGKSEILSADEAAGAEAEAEAVGVRREGWRQRWVGRERNVDEPSWWGWTAMEGDGRAEVAACVVDAVATGKVATKPTMASKSGTGRAMEIAGGPEVAAGVKEKV